MSDRLYIKIIDNKIHIKDRTQIIVCNGEFWYINPTEEMILNDGWQIYEPEMTELPDETIEPEMTIEQAREMRIAQILEYDTSDRVNQFTFNDYPIWLDKATRTGLKLRVDAELVNEKQNTTLWYNNIEFKLPTEYVQRILYYIEIYASQCYDNTQRHIANVMKLETIEEINNYDITEGYPARLAFKLEDPEEKHE